jgi:hypothetical protein
MTAARGRIVVGMLLASIVALRAAAQGPPATPEQTEPGAPERPSALPESTAAKQTAGDGPAAEETAETQPVAPAQERLGRYRVGPLYFTPSLQIGTIGMDTNVFYTPSDRRADFVASGGPALEAVLRIKGALRLRSLGALQYQYFVRTEAQRRLTGAASTRLEWETVRTGFSLEGGYAQEQRRPSFEVDRRVLGTVRRATASLRRGIFGRTRLLLTGDQARYEVEPGEVHLGVDLRSALSRDETRIIADLDHGLTVKTSVALIAERTLHRHRFDRPRDADTDRLMVGLRTDATALISGRALAGVLEFRPRAPGLSPRQVTVWEVAATLNISSKTRLGCGVKRDLSYSALAASGGLPTLTSDVYALRLEKELFYNLDLEVFARRTRLVNDGGIALDLGDGLVVANQRRDTADEVGADLGYVLRSRLRVGVAASYAQRRSTVSYFGIDGLLVGLTVRVMPPRL